MRGLVFFFWCLNHVVHGDTPSYFLFFSLLFLAFCFLLFLAFTEHYLFQIRFVLYAIVGRVGYDLLWLMGMTLSTLFFFLSEMR